VVSRAPGNLRERAATRTDSHKPLPLALLEQIDEVFLRFEAGVKAGRHGDLPALLDEVPKYAGGDLILGSGYPKWYARQPSLTQRTSPCVSGYRLGSNHI
jgi:hypothetical protein